MKKLLILSLMFGLSTPAMAEIVTVGVNGLVCDFCAQGITKKFSALPEVNKVDVDLEKKTVTLDIKNGKSLTDETITKNLQDSGFTVTNIQHGKS